VLEAVRPAHRRHVYFFSGFDPKGASYYHRIYREQAFQQGALTGVHYTVGRRLKTAEGNTRWTVHSVPTGAQAAAAGEGAAVETTYEYLRWDDIVRAQWPRTAMGVFKESLRTYRSAVLPALRAWPAAPNTVRSLFYPLVYWWLAVMLAVVFAGGLVWIAVGQGWPLAAAGVVGLAAGGGWLAGAWWLEKRLHTSWLLRIFSFAHAWAIDAVPGLSSRLNAASRQIADRLQDPAVDEVLIVGFSMGRVCSSADSPFARRLPRGAGQAVYLDVGPLYSPAGTDARGRCLPRRTSAGGGQCGVMLGRCVGA